MRWNFHWFKVEALFGEEEEFGVRMRTSFGCTSLIYSYRVKYSDLLAPFFLSSLEIVSKELIILNSMSSCGFFVLIKAGLDKALLWVFSS